MLTNRVQFLGAVGLIVTVGLAAGSGAASAPATGSRQATDSEPASSKIVFTRGSNFQRANEVRNQPTGSTL